jgi:hypothetical protein
MASAAKGGGIMHGPKNFTAAIQKLPDSAVVNHTLDPMEVNSRLIS